jgi:hypothetical protein
VAGPGGADGPTAYRSGSGGDGGQVVILAGPGGFLNTGTINTSGGSAGGQGGSAGSAGQVTIQQAPPSPPLPVPEPSSLALLTVGGAALAGWRAGWLGRRAKGGHDECH